MSKLDKLIAELCPDGVEWKTLGEVARIQRGASPRPIAKFITDEENGVPWIKIGDTIPNSKYVSHTKQKITLEGAQKSRVLKKGDFIISNSMSFGRAYILNIDGAIHDGWAAISDFENKLNSDFLYHFLSSDLVQNYWVSKINSGSVSNLNSEIIKSLEIPLPPLQIQEEIVRILDNFTELTAELTAELTDRKKQYEYYRDSLLTFDDEVPRVTLGEIATVIRGGNFQKKDFTETGVPCIHYGQIYTRYGLYATETITFVNGTVAKKSKFASKNDIVMAVTSENIEDVCKCVVWLGEDDAAISGHTAIIKHNQNSKFLAYYFNTAMFFKDKIKLAHGTKVIEVTPSKLTGIKIPLPPLPEQQRIVDILDRFDTLVNDIQQGLPAEIELRKKQYEYYRDKLLTFNKPQMNAGERE